MNVPQILMIIWLTLRVGATVGLSAGKYEDVDSAQFGKKTLKVLFQTGVVALLCYWGGFWK